MTMTSKVMGDSFISFEIPKDHQQEQTVHHKKAPTGTRMSRARGWHYHGGITPMKKISLNMKQIKASPPMPNRVNEEKYFSASLDARKVGDS